jgi:hypothetical protein
LILDDELPLEPDPLVLMSNFRDGGGDAPLRLSSFVIPSSLGDLRFRLDLERSGVNVPRSSRDPVDLARTISGNSSAPSSSRARINSALSLFKRQIPITISHDIAHNARLILAFNLEYSGCRLEEIVKRFRRAMGMSSMEKFQMAMDSSVTRSSIDILEGKREAMSDEDIGGAGVDGKLKRVGIDRMRVEIGSSRSTLFDVGAESLIC